MKTFFNKSWFMYFAYLVVALIGIWTLTKLWIPNGYAIAGHDSGLALDARNFLKTRFFAWDDRIGFGVDNSPHFGSIILHSIDYILSVIAGVSYAGNQLATFFWVGAIFVFAFIFSYSLKDKLGEYFVYLFPVFLTFNFFIFQSIFILERAKYELICVVLLFLTLGFNVIFDETKSVLRSSIVFAFFFSIFNGGSWLALPLYGSLLVAILVYLLFAIGISFKEKKWKLSMRAFGLSFLSGLFFILLNLYSILPFVSTLVSSDYAKVIDRGTISAGEEWLNYISRGSSWLNLFRFQGVPEWYLSGGLPNPDISYAGTYLTNNVLIVASFLIPFLVLVGLLFAKKRVEKYLIWFFIMLLIVSVFFASGTNSPLGFLYSLLYERIPGFSIFRSPYYKFGSSYVLAISALLAYSLSKLSELLHSRVLEVFYRKFKNLSSVLNLLFVLIVIIVWFLYNFIAFNRRDLFNWQRDKSTLVNIPSYVGEFDNWLTEVSLNGRILMVPALDDGLRSDSYTWGYWSLSPALSVLSHKGDFVVNDTSNDPHESEWINKTYTLLLAGDPAFIDATRKLGIKYVLLRRDILSQNHELQRNYLNAIQGLVANDELRLVKSVGPWSIYSIKELTEDYTFRLTNNIFSIPKENIFLAKEIITSNYGEGYWLDMEDISSELKGEVSSEFYPLTCGSCEIENLNRFVNFPPVRVLPNSPFYRIKKKLIEKDLNNSQDENSKVGAYLGLVLIKLSEIRSMYALNIDEKYILLALKDMNYYLKSTEDIISKSEQLKKNYYIASRIYATMNTLQRFFRDHMNKSNFDFEDPTVKNEIVTTLWQVVSTERLFETLLVNSDRLSYEKFFDINLPEDGQYRLMIDKETLPSDGDGGYLYPYKLLIKSVGDPINIGITENNRWIFTDTVNLSRKDQLEVLFDSLPNLFKLKKFARVDVPQGTRGCLTGEIRNFNKNKGYKFIITADKGISNVRLYVDEGNKSDISRNGFLRGDVEVDALLDSGGNAFTYVYSPSNNVTNPQIYICRYDTATPENIKINVLEIFSPIVYAVKDKASKTSDSAVLYEKINPTRYSISVDYLNRDTMLIFNQTFNDQWKLYDEEGRVLTNHFRIDGYANAWNIPKGKKYNLLLVYEPQNLFGKGVRASILSAVLLIATYLVSKFKRKNNG